MLIQNEKITTDGTNKEFTLANNYKAGSLLIQYNGYLFYRFSEVYSSNGSDNNKVLFDFIPLSTDEVYATYLTLESPQEYNLLRYGTVRQFAEISRVDLTGLDFIDLEKIIRQAESYIDSIVGGTERYYKYYSNDYEGQALNFPRAEDYDEDLNLAYIPRQITLATIFGAEHILLQGNLNAENLEKSKINSEKLGDYSYTKKDVDRSKWSEKDYAMEAIGTRAVAMLNNLTSKYGRLILTSPTENRLLNSRKRFINENY